MMTIGFTALGGLLAMSQLQVFSGTGLVMGEVGDTIGSFAALKADSNVYIKCKPSGAGSSTSLAWGIFAASTISGWEPHTSTESTPKSAGCHLSDVAFAKATFPVNIKAADDHVGEVQTWTTYIQFRQDTGTPVICGKVSYISSNYNGPFTCELPSNLNA